MKRFWAQRNGRERILLIACVLAVIIAVPLLLAPPDGGGGKLLSASKARDEYQKQVRDKERMEAEVEKLKPRIAGLVYSEAPEKVLPRVIRTLQDQARKAGIHLREIKPLRAKKLSGVTRVPLTVRFASRFDQSLPFIYAVEDPAGRMVVEKFSISSPDSKSKTVDVEIQVALFTSDVEQTEVESGSREG